MSISVVAVAAAVVAAAASDAVSGTCQSDLGRCLGQGQRDVAAMARMVCEAAIQALIRLALRALGIPGQLQPFRNGQRDVEIVPSHGEHDGSYLRRLVSPDERWAT